MATMIADTMIVDPNTGEIIAEAGQSLDSEDLYRIEVVMALPPTFAPQAPLPCPFCDGDLLDRAHQLVDGQFYCGKSDQGGNAS